MTGNTMHARRALLCATAVLACSTLAACGGDDGNAGLKGVGVSVGGVAAVFSDNRALRLIGWLALVTGVAALVVGWRETRAQRGL